MMEAAAGQSGSARISPLLVAVVASVTIASLAGLSVMTGVLSNKPSPVRSEEPLTRIEPKPPRPGVCASCGTVEAIRTVEVLEQAGATGGAQGLRTGKQSGEARPNAAPSVLDTLSGAFAGSEAVTSARKRQAFRVTVRMDDGSFRAVSLSSPPAFAVGDKVRVVEGRLVRS
jgi:outer membrane lipoprotein SlyB